MHRFVVAACAVVLGSPLAAQNLMDQFQATQEFCFARVYDPAHLAAHPDQTVTSMRLSPFRNDLWIDGEQVLLMITLTRRGSAERAGQVAYCSGAKMLDCGLEGDAGQLTITPSGDGSLELTVGRYGISFEDSAGYFTLYADRGDDRTFLLHRADKSACF